MKSNSTCSMMETSKSGGKKEDMNEVTDIKLLSVKRMLLRSVKRVHDRVILLKLLRVPKIFHGRIKCVAYFRECVFEIVLCSGERSIHDG